MYLINRLSEAVSKRAYKSLLKRILGQYVHDFDTDQFDVSLSAGTLRLTDLELRVDTVHELIGDDVAFKLSSAVVGSIEVQLPTWSTLLQSGCDVYVHSVEVDLEPKIADQIVAFTRFHFDKITVRVSSQSQETAQLALKIVNLNIVDATPVIHDDEHTRSEILRSATGEGASKPMSDFVNFWKKNIFFDEMKVYVEALEGDGKESAPILYIHGGDKASSSCCIGLQWPSDASAMDSRIEVAVSLGSIDLQVPPLDDFATCMSIMMSISNQHPKVPSMSAEEFCEEFSGEDEESSDDSEAEFFDCDASSDSMITKDRLVHLSDGTGLVLSTESVNVRLGIDGENFQWENFRVMVASVVLSTQLDGGRLQKFLNFQHENGSVLTCQIEAGTRTSVKCETFSCLTIDVAGDELGKHLRVFSSVSDFISQLSAMTVEGSTKVTKDDSSEQVSFAMDVKFVSVRVTSRKETQHEKRSILLLDMSDLKIVNTAETPSGDARHALGLWSAVPAPAENDGIILERKNDGTFAAQQPQDPSDGAADSTTDMKDMNDEEMVVSKIRALEYENDLCRLATTVFKLRAKDVEVVVNEGSPEQLARILDTLSSQVAAHASTDTVKEDASVQAAVETEFEEEHYLCLPSTFLGITFERLKIELCESDWHSSSSSSSSPSSTRTPCPQPEDILRYRAWNILDLRDREAASLATTCITLKGLDGVASFGKARALGSPAHYVRACASDVSLVENAGESHGPVIYTTKWGYPERPPQHPQLARSMSTAGFCLWFVHESVLSDSVNGLSDTRLNISTYGLTHSFRPHSKWLDTMMRLVPAFAISRDGDDDDLAKKQDYAEVTVHLSDTIVMYQPCSAESHVAICIAGVSFDTSIVSESRESVFSIDVQDMSLHLTNHSISIDESEWSIHEEDHECAMRLATWETESILSRTGFSKIMFLSHMNVKMIFSTLENEAEEKSRTIIRGGTAIVTTCSDTFQKLMETLNILSMEMFSSNEMLSSLASPRTVDREVVKESSEREDVDSASSAGILDNIDLSEDIFKDGPVMDKWLDRSSLEDFLQEDDWMSVFVDDVGNAGSEVLTVKDGSHHLNEGLGKAKGKEEDRDQDEVEGHETVGKGGSRKEDKVMKEENTWIDDRQNFKVFPYYFGIPVDSAAHGTSMTHHLTRGTGKGDSQDEMCISTVIIEDLSLRWSLLGGKDWDFQPGGTGSSGSQDNFLKTISQNPSARVLDTTVVDNFPGFSKDDPAPRAKKSAKWWTFEVEDGTRSTRKTDETLELVLQNIALKADTYDAGKGANLYSTLTVAIREFEVYDHVWVSPLRKMLCSWQNTSTLPRETGSAMVKVEFDTILRPGVSDPLTKEEYDLCVEMLPLRLNVDQDSLAILLGFVDRVVSEENNQHAMKEENSGMMEEPPYEMFFRSIDVRKISVKIDYLPKRVDLSDLRNGNLAQLINITTIEGLELELPCIQREAMHGFKEFAGEVGDAYVEAILQEQLHRCLAGISIPPIRSIANVVSGAADMVILPLQSYREGSTIWRGAKLGVASFAKAFTLETLHTVSKLSLATASVLESAVGMLGSNDDADNAVRGGGGGVYHRDRPLSMDQAARGATSIMTQHASSAARTIVLLPVQKRARSASGLVTSVIKAVPVAVLEPMIGAAKATSHIMVGARNAMDEDVRMEQLSKYKF
eukprot:g3991.t1